MIRNPNKNECLSAAWISSRGLAFKVLLGMMLVAVAVLFGRHFTYLIPILEHWIAASGPLGYVVFILVVVVCTSLYVPDTLFALMAGVVFGLWRGSGVIMIAALLTAVLDFTLSRYFFAARGRRWLDKNPRLGAIERAASREGLLFLILLRLTPIHPVTVSYVLGVTNTRFGVFLAACVGLFPALFVEVYFGYMAHHAAQFAGGVSKHSSSHLVVDICGLVACIVFLVWVTRIAHRALDSEKSGS
ncbi:MAG: VTT domain-containing protein [Akkermansiaceae bacterium]|nr:VTT domain-containing protein [Akkermansiaceae bacterium]